MGRLPAEHVAGGGSIAPIHSKRCLRVFRPRGVAIRTARRKSAILARLWFEFLFQDRFPRPIPTYSHRVRGLLCRRGRGIFCIPSASMRNPEPLSYFFAGSKDLRMVFGREGETPRSNGRVLLCGFKAFGPRGLSRGFLRAPGEPSGIQTIRNCRTHRAGWGWCLGCAGRRLRGQSAYPSRFRSRSPSSRFIMTILILYNLHNNKISMLQVNGNLMPSRCFISGLPHDYLGSN